MLRRSGALALFALLTLTACDSGSPDDPNTPTPSTPGALVGSWTLAENTTETYLTVNEAQVLVDQNGPTTGALQVSGAQSGTLRYMSVNPSYGEVVLTSYDPRISTYPAERVEARLRQSGYSNIVFVGASGTYTQYESYSNTSPYTYADGRLSVRLTTFQQSSGGASVTLAGGLLEYRTTPIAAGARTLARREVTPFQGGFDGLTAVRYILADGGALRAERDLAPNRTISAAGTWQADGAQLRLSTVYEQVTETETFRYTVTSTTLTLGVTQDGCLRDTNCLRNQEQIFGLRPGTLTAVQTEDVGTFTRSPVAARPASPEARVSPLLAARREAAIWPRALALPAADAAAR